MNNGEGGGTEGEIERQKRKNREKERTHGKIRGKKI